MSKARSMTIGKFAKAAGISADTVRFYEREGLLQKSERTAAGYRIYDPNEVDRVRSIRRAKELGFTLEEISELLARSGSGRTSKDIRTVAERRLREVQTRLTEMMQIRDALQGLVKSCHGDRPAAECPIIRALVPAKTSGARLAA